MQKFIAQTAYIVDDDEAILDSLGMFLDSAGIRTRTYERADTFLEEYRPGLRGCLLLDIRLPSISGLDLQEDLSAVGSALPIIFMTGHADVPTAVQALKGGAFDFIEKPFDNGKLLDLVWKAFETDARNHEFLQQQEEIKERLQTLTPRESEVLDYIINGKATKVIALELNLSQRTVEIYRANVMQKMQTKSVAHLVKMVSEINDARSGLA